MPGKNGFRPDISYLSWIIAIDSRTVVVSLLWGPSYFNFQTPRFTNTPHIRNLETKKTVYLNIITDSAFTIIFFIPPKIEPGLIPKCYKTWKLLSITSSTIDTFIMLNIKFFDVCLNTFNVFSLSFANICSIYFAVRILLFAGHWFLCLLHSYLKYMDIQDLLSYSWEVASLLRIVTHTPISLMNQVPSPDG